VIGKVALHPQDVVAAVLAGDEQVELRPYDYATSAPIDLVGPAGALDDAPVLRKDLSPASRLAEARGTRPAFLLDPSREIAVYLNVLPDWLGSPACYGAVEDAEHDRYWLFLERVRGVELWQVGELDVWADVARWLARMHSGRLHEAAAPHAARRLVTYDAAYYRRWPERARSFATTRERRRGLERVLRGHDDLVERLLALPTTFIHGELYPSNVLIGRRDDGGVRVAAIDWETAAVGPALVDLAALTEGWGEDERLQLVEAYRVAASAAAPPMWAPGSDAALGACRLHLCLRWLGWAEGWSAPPEHARDWLGLALRLTEEMAL
jgi:aminoglycoside phosphotransferase (APT) family kinase protein